MDENLEASHTPASTDANHVFSLSNGELKVTIPDGAGSGEDYSLDDGSLYVNPGFSGSVTAAYEFTDEPTLEIDFEYNHNGLRTQKRVVENGITTIYDYTLHGKLITHLTKRVMDLEGAETDKEELHFFYDAQSRPAFVEYEGSRYRYIYNLQGDIVAIVDAAGNLMVEYRYDAWGKYQINTQQSDIGVLNPFMYRGYVYDLDIDLYYVSTRYYEPELVRWINRDEVEFVKIDSRLGNCNLFAYCYNSSVNYVDVNGYFALSALLGCVIGGAVAGALIGAVSYLVSSGINNSEVTSKGLVHAIGLGALNGAIGGAVGVVSAGTLSRGFLSVGTGLAFGTIAAINTEGSTIHKIGVGFTVGITTAASTFAGASVEMLGATGIAETAMITYSSTLAISTPAEIISVSAQQYSNSKKGTNKYNEQSHTHFYKALPQKQSHRLFYESLY